MISRKVYGIQTNNDRDWNRPDPVVQIFHYLFGNRIDHKFHGPPGLPDYVIDPNPSSSLEDGESIVNLSID